MSLIDYDKLSTFTGMEDNELGVYLLTLINGKTDLHSDPKDYKEESEHLIDTELGELEIYIEKMKLTIIVNALVGPLSPDTRSIYRWGLEEIDGVYWAWVFR